MTDPIRGLPDFDPKNLPAPPEAAARAMFPDAEQLVKEALTDKPRPEWWSTVPMEIRVAHVPNTDVYVLYAIFTRPEPVDDNEGDVLLISIRSQSQIAN